MSKSETMYAGAGVDVVIAAPGHCDDNGELREDCRSVQALTELAVLKLRIDFNELTQEDMPGEIDSLEEAFPSETEAIKRWFESAVFQQVCLCVKIPELKNNSHIK